MSKQGEMSVSDISSGDHNRRMDEKTDDRPTQSAESSSRDRNSSTAFLRTFSSSFGDNPTFHQRFRSVASASDDSGLSPLSEDFSLSEDEADDEFWVPQRATGNFEIGMSSTPKDSVPVLPRRSSCPNFSEGKAKKKGAKGSFEGIMLECTDAFDTDGMESDLTRTDEEDDNLLQGSIHRFDSGARISDTTPKTPSSRAHRRKRRGRKRSDPREANVETPSEPKREATSAGGGRAGRGRSPRHSRSTRGERRWSGSDAATNDEMLRTPRRHNRSSTDIAVGSAAVSGSYLADDDDCKPKEKSDKEEVDGLEFLSPVEAKGKNDLVTTPSTARPTPTPTTHSPDGEDSSGRSGSLREKVRSLLDNPPPL